MERFGERRSLNRRKSGQQRCRDCRLDNAPLGQDDGVGAIDSHRCIGQPKLDRLMKRIEDRSAIVLVWEYCPGSRFAAFGAAESSERVLTHDCSQSLRLIKRQ
jgi:hypothetical protein